jgi:hypothetical protein
MDERIDHTTKTKQKQKSSKRENAQNKGDVMHVFVDGREYMIYYLNMVRTMG